MLEDLHVKDIALLHEGWLEFGPGLTVLTGETGAGKTALLSALKLLIGERGDATAVRSGAPELLAEARFYVDGEEMIAKRRITRDGRSKCYLDMSMVTVGALQEQIGPLLDLHGQHKHQTLLKPHAHVDHLDCWIGDEAKDAKSSYQDARAKFFEAQHFHDETLDEIKRATLEVETERIALRDIEEASIQEGEYEKLLEKLPRLQHGEQLIDAARSAQQALYAEQGAIAYIVAARESLARASEVDSELQSLTERIQSVQTDIEDIAGEVRDYGSSVDADPAELNRVLDRLAVIEGIAKRYGPRIEDVFARLARAQRAIEISQDSDGVIERAQEELTRCKEAYDTSARSLSLLREEAAFPFSVEVNETIKELGMAGACIRVAQKELPFEAWREGGSDSIEFMYQPTPTTEPLPFVKIASGGEISRLMLALKSATRNATQAQTLVFDEIDAGIGGATALKVGNRLKELAQGQQVIVVTHLAQVAAFADAHILVKKIMQGDDVQTTVRPLDDSERTQEIARMLSGSQDTSAIVHAEALLAEVKASKKA